MENSIDGYHVLPLHITYFEYLEHTSGSRPTLGEFGESFGLGNGHAVVAFRGPWARPVARFTPALGERNRERVEAAYAELDRKYGPERADLIGRTDRVLLIFPNLVVLDIMGVVVRAITPTRAGHTKVTQWSLASAGEDSVLRAQRLESFVAFQGPGDSRRRMTSSIRSVPGRPAPRPACHGRTSPAACTASTGARPAAPTTNCRSAHFWRQWQTPMMREDPTRSVRQPTDH